MERSASDSLLRSGHSMLSALSAPRGLSEQDQVYLSGLRPYLGNPMDTSRLMAKHPLSETRKGANLGPEINMRELWRLRQNSNFTIPCSTSMTQQSEALPNFRHTFQQTRSGAFANEDAPKGAEFTSRFTQMCNRTKHTRSPLSPMNKYQQRAVSSQAIGWETETAEGQSLIRGPTHGLVESKTTKRYVDMQATNVGACLRLCK
eukprot:TRINITY_DN10673_c0_g1_i1.p1 TRINITY_DN10673_c0_g1~~TRINITY_DN10673_c0_g1_i1.p1  ORF type:complete len:204 (+),score=27.40 TRINITY_DN10673_c0_g1_i1:212-823(+)